MRWAAVLLAVAATLLLSACSDQGHAPESARLTLLEQGSTRRVAVRSWSLPSSGRVVGLGGVPGNVFVAQRWLLSRLRPDGSSEGAFDPGSGDSIVALSRHGRRFAVAGDEGVLVGGVGSFDPHSTALSSGELLGRFIVLDGHPARIFDGRLWDLDVPRMTLVPRAYGQIAAFDPRQRWIAIGEDGGKVAVLSGRTGSKKWEVPRSSAARFGDEIAALAISTAGRVITLDEGGWASCESGSAPVLPPAPPGMPAAIASEGDGFWATRGGIAVFVDCGSGQPRLRCEVRGEWGDPRSAALLALRGRVYAAGLKRSRIVLLPSCR